MSPSARWRWWHFVRVGSRFGVWSVVLLTSSICFIGCSDRLEPPSTGVLAEFKNAGPSGPTVDMDRVAQAMHGSSLYRVVPGDVLELDMPGIVTPRSSEIGLTASERQTYVCRVNDDGMIVLPVVGLFPVLGKSLAEIEAAVLGEYYPKYIKAPVPVYVAVREYRTQRVSIAGAVAQPGIYALRHNQMSLVALLMEAGGIVEKGAAVINIKRSGPVSSRAQEAPASVRSRDPAARPVQWTYASLPGKGPGRAGFRSAHFDQGRRLTFTREGPLNTTGWLVYQEDGAVVARAWLDLGNGLQRWAFLGALATRSEQSVPPDLEKKLSRLARFLESNPPMQNGSLGASATGWDTTGNGAFALSFSGVTTRVASTSQIGEIQKGEPAGRDAETTIVLPVRGLNIPFADASLQEGDTVIVEPPEEQFISVIGLVNSPGVFPYSSTAHYTLVEAVALAGGLDLTADPRLVSVYRLSADGAIASVTFQLVNPKQQEQLTEAMAVPLKPGDVVSVEHTRRTRMNVFLDRIFRINLGLYFSPDSLWDRDD